MYRPERQSINTDRSIIGNSSINAPSTNNTFNMLNTDFRKAFSLQNIPEINNFHQPLVFIPQQHQQQQRNYMNHQHHQQQLQQMHQQQFHHQQQQQLNLQFHAHHQPSHQHFQHLQQQQQQQQPKPQSVRNQMPI